MQSFFDKVAGLLFLTEVFSCEYCEIFKSNYFEEHLRAAVYVSYQHFQFLSHFHFFPPSLSDGKSRDCKIRSLKMSCISCCTRRHIFYFICATDKRSSTSLNFFFSRWRMMTSKQIKRKESLLKQIDLETRLIV